MKITVDGVEYKSTGDALLAARRIESAVQEAKAKLKPKFTVVTERKYNLYCDWCRAYVDSVDSDRDIQQAEWEHMAKVHPGTERI